MSAKWPAFFPPIDEMKAARGKQHYARHCAACHEVIDDNDPDRRIVRPFYKPKLIGTDTARLEAVLATAPFLNNGSVPNLYQLLLPAQEQFESFYVKSREFDPVHVGFETKQVPGAFLLDTTKAGNRNIGHEFGTDMSDEQRWELVEYLKTL